MCSSFVYNHELVPWGMQAIQRISFAGDEQINWTDMDLIPTMILHWVKTKEAIALRMLNVPKFIAENMANTVRSENISLETLDQWLEKPISASGRNHCLQAQRLQALNVNTCGKELKERNPGQA
ncbi:hypothetical protein PITCH_A970009 [uncultured Desulfobacterium sp.]|uniref:Uncharacterized protein n=1 Tax=uncultured Desulfobacterium sp. TaxID=201089 RepID=A0A445N440_9BACT|nr:hypothetical protein PITCH_A970009 [uncultured Desulfobacterium sp.]